MFRRFVFPSRRLAAVAVVAVLRAFALLAAAGAVPGLERAASANGRLPGTSSIVFRQGHESDIVAGLTFGMAILA